MPERKNYLDSYSEKKQIIKRNTPINNFKNIGVINNLINISSREEEQIYNEIEKQYNVFDITKSNGAALDNIGLLVGKNRSQTITPLDTSSTNFRFYMKSGTAGSMISLFSELYGTKTKKDKLVESGYITIDGSYNIESVTIPSGTIISNQSESVRYETLEDATFTNNDTEKYVPVRSLISGATGNVTANTLNKHNLLYDSLLREVSKYILCTNNFPINNGKFPIGDDEYRYSLGMNQISYGTNEARIRSEILNLPGIRNVLFERGTYGNGTSNIIIEGINPLVSDGMLSMVESVINSISTNSEIITVEKPIYKGIELKLTLVLENEANVSTVTENVRSSVISYINNIIIGGTIIWNELVDIIMSNEGVTDFIVDYYRIGNYDSINKINKNHVALKTRNQKAKYNEKFYTDSGLCSLCNQ